MAALLLEFLSSLRPCWQEIQVPQPAAGWKGSNAIQTAAGSILLLHTHHLHGQNCLLDAGCWGLSAFGVHQELSAWWSFTLLVWSVDLQCCQSAACLLSCHSSTCLLQSSMCYLLGAGPQCCCASALLILFDTTHAGQHAGRQSVTAQGQRMHCQQRQEHMRSPNRAGSRLGTWRAPPAQHFLKDLAAFAQLCSTRCTWYSADPTSRVSHTVGGQATEVVVTKDPFNLPGRQNIPVLLRFNPTLRLHAQQEPAQLGAPHAKYQQETRRLCFRA